MTASAPTGSFGRQGRQTRTPIQFTVRTLLAVAVLVSMYFGAPSLFDGVSLAAARVVVFWLAIGGLCWTLRGWTLLAALGTGPVVVTVLWSLMLWAGIDGDARSLAGNELVLCAFAWGLVLTVTAAVASSTLKPRQERRAYSSYGAAGHTGRSVPQCPAAVSPARLACRMALVRMAISVLLAAIVVLAAARHPWIAPAVTLLLDLPLLTLYSPPVPPSVLPYSGIGLGVASLSTGGALHFITGWIIGEVRTLLEVPGRAEEPLPVFGQHL